MEGDNGMVHSSSMPGAHCVPPLPPPRQNVLAGLAVVAAGGWADGKAGKAKPALAWLMLR